MPDYEALSGYTFLLFLICMIIGLLVLLAMWLPWLLLGMAVFALVVYLLYHFDPFKMRDK